MRKVAALVLLVAATAHAAPQTTGVTKVLETIASGFGNVPESFKAPRFAFTNAQTDASPSDYGSLLVPSNAAQGTLKQAVTGVSADGAAGWAAGAIAPNPCTRGALPDDSTGDSSYYEAERCMWQQKAAFARGAIVVEYDGKAWQPVAWHLYGVAPGYVGAAEYQELTDTIAAGAVDAHKVFVASLVDPKAFIKTLSPRKDVLMFGSGRAERFVGARQIGATIKKWNLAFKLRAGVVAGMAGKSIAWVAANLEATSIKKPSSKPTYYRALLVYEHVGDAWQLVQASFSDVKPPS